MHDDANLKLFGSITKRGSQIFVDEVSLNLIYEIKLNIFNIGKMLKKFMFHESNKYITFYIRVTLLQLNKKKN